METHIRLIFVWQSPIAKGGEVQTFDYQAGECYNSDRSEYCKQSRRKVPMAQLTSVPSIKITEGNSANKTKFVVGGAVVALAIVYLIYTGIQSSATYFLTIDELYAKGEVVHEQTVRVSGWVDIDTIQFDNRNLILDFDITSEDGTRMAVTFNGPKPDQMRTGTEAIVEGKYDGEQFVATNLLLKCPSKYEGGEMEEIQVEAVGT